MPRVQIPAPDRIAVTVPTAATLLSVPEGQIHAWIRLGALSAVTVGGMPRVWVQELRELPQRLRELGAGHAPVEAFAFKPELVQVKARRG